MKKRFYLTNIRLELIREASKDYGYLLSRGYNWNSALNFVSGRYRLSKIERMILLRAVFSNDEILERKKKLVTIDYIRRKTLSIDGFNVLMTIKAALLGAPLILCQDGFIRDILSAFEKVKIDLYMYISLELLLMVLSRFSPNNVFLFFDSKVSKSGLFAAHVRKRLKELNLKGEVSAVPKADILTLMHGDIVASSDSVIISRAKHVIDLGGYIAKSIAIESILTI